MSPPGALRAAAAALLLALAACATTEEAEEAATNVLLLRQGTVSGLEDLKGTGPFTEYDVPPDRMLEVVERAAKKAQTRTGAFVLSVWSSKRYSNVVAKEAPCSKKAEPGYSDEWQTAMIAWVHPVRGCATKSRVEVHAVSRGPFDRGVVDWERDLPRWIREVTAAERR